MTGLRGPAPSFKGGGRKTELWQVEYQRDAYTDQTGLQQSGWVVTEQVVVAEVGDFPVAEAYTGKVFERAGKIAVDRLGREYRYFPNLLDYHGGGIWKRTADDAFFKRAPLRAKGYCYPDGRAPVEHLMPAAS